MDLTWIAVPIAIAIAPLILGLVFVIRKMLKVDGIEEELRTCLLYTSPSPRD